MLAAIWSSPSFAAAVKNRFGAIRVKGFCINREVFNCGVNPLPAGGGFVNFVYRIDKDCAYGAAVGQTVSAMRA